MDKSESDLDELSKFGGFVGVMVECEECGESVLTKYEGPGLRVPVFCADHKPDHRYPPGHGDPPDPVRAKELYPELATESGWIDGGTEA
jgi:hypothetical protein